MSSTGVLFISNIFSPQQSGGTQRIVSFFNALNASVNHEVFLVTTKCYSGHPVTVRGPATTNEHVYREHDFYKLWKTRTTHNESGVTDTSVSRFRRQLRMLLYLIFCFPDEAVTFIPFALVRSLTLIRKHSISYVVSTYPSASNLIIGWIISSLFGNKHIVDLREPWLDKPDWTMRYSPNFLSDTRLRFENLIERKILRAAHKVIMNHRWMSQQYASLVRDPAVLVVIPNGFDEDLIPTALKESSYRSESDTMKLIYTGSYYLAHQPDFIFKAIARAIEKEHRLRDRIEFNIYGSIDNQTQTLIDNYSDLFAIKYHSYVRRNTVFQQICNSDLGVITFPPNAWSHNMIPGKIYEYKKLRLPLLIIGAKDSALQALAEEWGNTFYPADDTEGIADFLLMYSAAGANFNGAEQSVNIDDYSYDRLNRRFLSLLT